MNQEDYNKEFFEKSINGALSEFKAGKSLDTSSIEGKTWNEAHNRCIRILERYLKGEGLFQL